MVILEGGCSRVEKLAHVFPMLYPIALSVNGDAKTITQEES